MKKLAYIRVSTFEQNTARQLDGMTFDKSFTDKLSGINKERPALLELIDYIRDGDEVWVHSIDRLARSLIDLHSLIKQFTDKGATVHFKTEQLTFDGDEHNPHQMLHLSMLGAFAQFERELIKQRQLEGIAKAKERGAYKDVGRKGLPQSTIDSIKSMAASGSKKTDIAKELGLSRAVIYKYL
jgi:DNA invertase Pin-like site-specific DNA recombinase|tara:strand:- start:355 stop:903 length:549 start_codon:yes stop_codon:yes gene_type:complete